MIARPGDGGAGRAGAGSAGRVLRRALDGLYALSAAFAALSLLGILVVMLGQVALREMGRQFPAADDVAAYLCVSATFGALAQAFRRGELIRVGMLLDRLGARARRLAELAVLALAAVVVGTMVWWTAGDVVFSREIEEVAQGSVAFPLWIPKLAMPLGAGVLLVAILDEMARVAGGRTPSYSEAAAERAERGDFSAEV